MKTTSPGRDSVSAPRISGHFETGTGSGGGPKAGSRRLGLSWVVAWVVLPWSFAGLLSACGAVFPEVETPLKGAPQGRELSPAPPDDLLFVEIRRARIPERTRDGRVWDSGDLPDPFVILFLGERELLRTPIQSDTLAPTWPGQTRGNHRIPSGSTVRVELWENNPLNNQAICTKRITDLHAHAAGGPGTVELRCESGARIEIGVEPARARLGLGFFYELMTGRINVTRLYQESPAARAGLLPQDEVVAVMGKGVGGMLEGEAQSLINANARSGVELEVRHQSGKREIIEIQEGPVYPIVGEFGRPQAETRFTD